MPLAILDLVRTLTDERLPSQASGLQFERRWTPWLLAAFAGPALLFDRTAEGWRDETMSPVDIGWSAAITLGWAMIYGYLALKLVTFVVG